MTRQMLLRLHSEDLVVDNFAGGGGASLGIEMALGRSPDIAVNHDPKAVAMHAENHPGTRHLCESVWDVDPAEVTDGRRVALAWFSPDCTHFSKAKGGKPKSQNIRGLAWVVIRWAKAVKPRVIILENVEECRTWGPLLENGQPCKEQRGDTFKRWIGELESCGYKVEVRELRACDFGAPTTRKRLFVIARCDGEEIVWPNKTHTQAEYRTAAECIDWSVPCPSIFERKKPLVDNTMRRIARGIQRFAIDAASPFIAPIKRRVSPTLIQTGYGERPGQVPRVPGLHKPLGTVVAGGIKHALISAFLAKHYGGHENSGLALTGPVHTVTAQDHHALVSAFLTKYYGTSTGQTLGDPIHTVTTDALVDMNGDGLPDVVRHKSGGGLEVALNMGSGFCSWDGELAPEAEISTYGYSSVTQYADVVSDCIQLDSQDGSCQTQGIVAGVGQSEARLTDFDGDGLVDLYYVDSAAAQFEMGGGGGLAPPVGWDSLLPRDTEVTQSNWWAVYSDYMDLNGDGLDDIITSGPTSLQIESDDTSDGKPQRLLNRIDNGQGLITHIEYQPYNDASVAIHAPTQTNAKEHLWVVSKVISESEIDEAYHPAPDSVVELKYGDAIRNQDDRGRYGFRGFAIIETSSPHALGNNADFAVTQQSYDYETDWSGRLAETVVYADGFAKNEAASMVTQTWQETSLFAGTSLGYQVADKLVWNCAHDDGSFQSREDCLAEDPGQTTQNTWSAEHSMLANGNGPALHHVQTQVISCQEYWEDGCIVVDRDTETYADEDKYWVNNSGETRSVLLSTQLVQIGKTLSVVDDTQIYAEERYAEDGRGQNATELSKRNLQTGQVEYTEKPEQYGTGLRRSFQYAGAQISPVSVTNELGHTSTILTDLGTGQVLQSQGPNALECNSSERAGTRAEYDALARPTKVYVIGCEDGNPGEYLATSMSYSDFESGTPAFVETISYLDAADPSKTTLSRTYVDGAGRTVRTVVGDGTAEGIVGEFEFDARGQVVRTIGPNPASEAVPGDTVDNSYSYDSLGRVIEIRQAHSIDKVRASGLDIRYGFDKVNGNAIKTVEEHVGNGPLGITETHTDLFGRMVVVRELVDGANYAETRYQYDGNNNAVKITDADDIVTLMEHDWLSRRTKIIRGEREWSYAYDRNGNMRMETSPNGIGESADAPGLGMFSTSTLFDALDRPKSRVIGPRMLNAVQQDEYDANFVVFAYDDSCQGGVGRVCSVDTGNNLNTSYAYDYAGRITQQTERVSLPEGVVDFGDADDDPDFVESRTTYTSFDLGGRVTRSWLSDGPDQETSTEIAYAYHPSTGAPESLTWNGTEASVERNKVHQVTQLTVGCLVRNWEYDHFARVKRTVDAGTGATPCSSINGTVLSEEMSYFDSSEVAEHTVFRAGIPSIRKFGYSYDNQHQLIAARNGLDETLLDYQVGFAYTNAGRVKSVGDYAAGVGILGRAPLDYDPDGAGYGDGTLLGGDKHAPVYLSGSEMDLAYGYDFAGNVVRRSQDPAQGPGAAMRFAFDGLDQQRDAAVDKNNDSRELYYYDSTGARYMAVTYEQSMDSVPSRIRLWVGGMELWYSPQAPGNGNNSNGVGSLMELETSYAHLSLGGISLARLKMAGDTTTAEASFHNGLGHLMGAVDWETGEVSAAFVYGPYDEIIESVGDELDTHLRRFNGKEADQLSGLSYYGGRYYDSLSLSWTQADPKYLYVPDASGVEPRRLGLYQFSLNNPLRYMDPDGRDAKDRKTSKLPNTKDLVGVVKAMKAFNKNPSDKSAQALVTVSMKAWGGELRRKMLDRIKVVGSLKGDAIAQRGKDKAGVEFFRVSSSAVKGANWIHVSIILGGHEPDHNMNSVPVEDEVRVYTRDKKILQKYEAYLKKVGASPQLLAAVADAIKQTEEQLGKAKKANAAAKGKAKRKGKSEGKKGGKKPKKCKPEDEKCN